MDTLNRTGLSQVNRDVIRILVEAKVLGEFTKYAKRDELIHCSGLCATHGVTLRQIELCDWPSLISYVKNREVY